MTFTAAFCRTLLVRAQVMLTRAVGLLLTLGFLTLHTAQAQEAVPAAPVKSFAEPTPKVLLDARKGLDRQQFSKVIEPLENYIQSAPKDLEALFMLAIAYAHTEQEAKAQQVLIFLTETFPEVPEPYNNLATLYAKQGDFDQARRLLEMAVRVKPDFAVAHENLGDIYARLAAQAYRQARDLDGTNQPLTTKLSTLQTIVELQPQVYVPRKVLSTPRIPALPF